MLKKNLIRIAILSLVSMPTILATGSKHPNYEAESEAVPENIDLPLYREGDSIDSSEHLPKNSIVAKLKHRNVGSLFKFIIALAIIGGIKWLYDKFISPNKKEIKKEPRK